ncbi:MAG: hypothetical protein HZA54_18510, partial [Planctomycetes bacterium]|nr:hypothetical protein [Planctomycetota bacterium]
GLTGGGGGFGWPSSGGAGDWGNYGGSPYEPTDMSGQLDGIDRRMNQGR